MENLQINEETMNAIAAYISENRLYKHERAVLEELAAAIRSHDVDQVNWFSRFGGSFREIYYNVHAYRCGLNFGFDHISFDKYGWLNRPKWMAFERIKLGKSDRYGEYSEIDLGRGPNHQWTFALHYCFGVAGGGWALSVYDPSFPSREAALNKALADLKKMMSEKVGNTDTVNFKQAIIHDTLKAIAGLERDRVQLSLF